MNDLELQEYPSAELLEEFAIEVMSSPSNRDQVALRFAGGDFNKMHKLIEAADTTQFTQRILELRRELKDADRLPTKEKFMADVHDKMSTMQGDLWLKTSQFYAKLAGFTEDTVQTSNTVVNVIQVPTVPQSHDEKTVWEQRAQAYSQDLQRQGKELVNGDS